MLPSLDALYSVEAFLVIQPMEERRVAEEGMATTPRLGLQFQPGTANTGTSLQPTAPVPTFECGPAGFRIAEHVPEPGVLDKEGKRVANDSFFFFSPMILK